MNYLILLRGTQMNNNFKIELKLKDFILDLDGILINFPKREYILKDKIVQCPL